MKPRERVFTALAHKQPDRIPRCEIWIDALLRELGQPDLENAHVNLGQDTIMMPTNSLVGSHAWRDGVDEWGRQWGNGMYMNGVVKNRDDLRRYSVNRQKANECFDVDRIEAIQRNFPNHCLMYGSHLGPFMAAYMAMGFEEFFLRIMDEPKFILEIMEERTEWAIAMFQKAECLGAELLIMGDDAAHKQAPMISPKMWGKFISPFHKKIVDSVSHPMVFHSDGFILPVIPIIIECGFAGLHGLEPAAGMDLAGIKREFGKDLTLIGNVDVGVLARNSNLAVHQEVERCVFEGGQNGGYMLSSCNSIFSGLNPASVLEYFRYSHEWIGSSP